MKTFDLSIETFEINSTETQAILKPSDSEISHLIADSRVFITSEITQLSLNLYASEMKSILFDKFQNLEHVDVNIKNQYTL